TVGIRHHAPKLEALEESAVASNAPVPIDDRPTFVLEQEHDHEHQRRKHETQKQRAQNIERSLEAHPVGPLATDWCRTQAAGRQRDTLVPDPNHTRCVFADRLVWDAGVALQLTLRPTLAAHQMRSNAGSPRSHFGQTAIGRFTYLLRR